MLHLRPDWQDWVEARNNLLRPTYDDLGVVVGVDKGTMGCRPLHFTDSDWGVGK